MLTPRFRNAQKFSVVFLLFSHLGEGTQTLQAFVSSSACPVGVSFWLLLLSGCPIAGVSFWLLLLLSGCSSSSSILPAGNAVFPNGALELCAGACQFMVVSRQRYGSGGSSGTVLPGGASSSLSSNLLLSCYPFPAFFLHQASSSGTVDIVGVLWKGKIRTKKSTCPDMTVARVLCWLLYSVERFVAASGLSVPWFLA